MHIDGRLFVPAVDGPARQRRRLAFSGAVAVSIAVNKKGELAGEPQLSLYGVPDEDDSGALIGDILLDMIVDVFEDLPRKERRSSEFSAEAIRRAVRRECADIWGKKPECRVFVHRV